MISRRGLAAALAVAAVTAVPASAAASGGPPPGSGGAGGGGAAGGGGGGGTPPPPVINPNPCATARLTTGGRLIFPNGSNANLSFNITSCSAGAETVKVLLTENGVGFSSSGVGQAPCTTSANWTAGPFTIKPASTQGFSTLVPLLTCPFNSQQDGVVATVTDATTGATLATAGTGFQRLPI